MRKAAVRDLNTGLELILKVLFLKMRKHESLFYKINTCLQKTTTHTGLQTKQIFSVKI